MHKSTPTKKYVYVPEKLNYIQIEQSARDKLLQTIRIILVSVLFTSFYLFLYFSFFETPKEKKLKAENKELADNYTQINTSLDELVELRIP